MDIEFEEFDSIEDIFLYMASIAPPMKNYLPKRIYLLYYTAEPLRNWNLSNDFYKGHVGKWNFRI